MTFKSTELFNRQVINGVFKDSIFVDATVGLPNFTAK
jgi:hypothetical protein